MSQNKSQDKPFVNHIPFVLTNGNKKPMIRPTMVYSLLNTFKAFNCDIGESADVHVVKALMKFQMYLTEDCGVDWGVLDEEPDGSDGRFRLGHFLVTVMGLEPEHVADLMEHATGQMIADELVELAGEFFDGLFGGAGKEHKKPGVQIFEVDAFLAHIEKEQEPKEDKEE